VVGVPTRLIVTDRVLAELAATKINGDNIYNNPDLKPILPVKDLPDLITKMHAAVEYAKVATRQDLFGHNHRITELCNSVTAATSSFQLFSGAHRTCSAISRPGCNE
jgi:hypothetical protein